jgi:hypothetical protein
MRLCPALMRHAIASVRDLFVSECGILDINAGLGYSADFPKMVNSSTARGAPGGIPVTVRRT